MQGECGTECKASGVAQLCPSAPGGKWTGAEQRESLPGCTVNISQHHTHRPARREAIQPWRSRCRVGQGLPPLRAGRPAYVVPQSTAQACHSMGARPRQLAELLLSLAA